MNWAFPKLHPIKKYILIIKATFIGILFFLNVKLTLIFYRFIIIYKFINNFKLNYWKKNTYINFIK